MHNRKRTQSIKWTILLFIFALTEPLEVTKKDHSAVLVTFNFSNYPLLNCLERKHTLKLQVDYGLCAKPHKSCSMKTLKRELKIDPAFTKLAFSQDILGDKLPGITWILSDINSGISEFTSPFEVRLKPDRKFLILKLSLKCATHSKFTLGSLLLPLLKMETKFIETSWVNFLINGD